MVQGAATADGCVSTCGTAGFPSALHRFLCRRRRARPLDRAPCRCWLPAVATNALHRCSQLVKQPPAGRQDRLTVVGVCGQQPPCGCEGSREEGGRGWGRTRHGLPWPASGARLLPSPVQPTTQLVLQRAKQAHFPPLHLMTA